MSVGCHVGAHPSPTLPVTGSLGPHRFRPGPCWLARQTPPATRHSTAVPPSRIAGRGGQHESGGGLGDLEVHDPPLAGPVPRPHLRLRPPRRRQLDVPGRIVPQQTVPDRRRRRLRRFGVSRLPSGRPGRRRRLWQPRSGVLYKRERWPGRHRDHLPAGEPTATAPVPRPLCRLPDIKRYVQI